MGSNGVREKRCLWCAERFLQEPQEQRSGLCPQCRRLAKRVREAAREQARRTA
jgi:hypothetical protein